MSNHWLPTATIFVQFQLLFLFPSIGPASSDDQFHQLFKGLTLGKSLQQTKYKNLKKTEFIQTLQRSKSDIELGSFKFDSVRHSTATEFQSDPWQEYDI